MKDYPYLYETHLHTSEGSACAANTGVEMAIALKNAGYAGMIVTEHNWNGNSNIDRGLPWAEWVKEYSKSYREAKAWGDENDFDVFFGYEAGVGSGIEFLMYGVTPEWMTEHPEIRKMDAYEHSKAVREAGGMVIHAHPYRIAGYIPGPILYPDFVDGVEGINCSLFHVSNAGDEISESNKKAIAYAAIHGLPITCGSDIHNNQPFGGGTAFKERLTSIEDYIDRIKNGGDYVLTTGKSWYDKQGKKIEK